MIVCNDSKLRAPFWGIQAQCHQWWGPHPTSVGREKASIGVALVDRCPTAYYLYLTMIVLAC